MDPITLDPPVKFPPVPAPRVVTPPAAPPKPAEPPAAASSPAPAAPPAPKPAGGRRLLVGIAAAASLAGGVAGVRYFGPAADPGSPGTDVPGQALFAEEKARQEAEKNAKAAATPGTADNGSAKQPETKTPATAPAPTWGTRQGGAGALSWPSDPDLAPAALFGGLYPPARDMALYRPRWPTTLPPAAPAYPSADLLAVTPGAAVPSAPAAPVSLPTAPPDLDAGLRMGPQQGSASSRPVPPPADLSGLGVAPLAPPPPSGLGVGPQPDPNVRPAGALDVPKPEPAKQPATPVPLPVMPDLPNPPASGTPSPASLPALPLGGPPAAPVALPTSPVPAAPVGGAAQLPATLPVVPDKPAAAAVPPPAAPAVPLPNGLGGPAAPTVAADPLGVKPAAGGATPAPVAEAPPRRPLTVDVYDPRPGDRYEGVSREFYGDGRYAAALQEYNRGRPLTPGQSVDVPPVHVLKKRFPQLTGVPASTGRPAPAADWQTSAGDPTFRPGRPRTFAVPAGGMSMRAVAREALGDPQRWEEVYNLNRAYDPGLVPGGVQLQLPAGGRPPE